MVRILIDAGSNVDSLNSDGKTALHLVCNRARRLIFEHEELAWVEYLLSLGADVHAKDSDGLTALHYTTLHGKNNYKIMKTLIDAGANVNNKTSTGWTALHWAAYQNNLPMIEYLLSCGAKADIRDNNNQIPLHRACSPMKFYDFAAIKLLVKNSGNIDVADRERCTPVMIMLLHILRGNKLVEQWQIIFKYLLQRSEVNVEDSQGNDILKMIINTYNIYKYHGKKDDPLKVECSKIFLRHLALVQGLNLSILKNILKTISGNTAFNYYFTQCQEEVSRAKETKLKNCWITYFNLLVDSKKKLKNYAGNEDLINDFTTSDYLKKFPIYGPSIKENMEKGIKKRELYDESSILLCDYWPIFKPSHLIIREILDCLSFRDMNKFCE